jgi:hypothetical protein
MSLINVFHQIPEAHHLDILGRLGQCPCLHPFGINPAGFDPGVTVADRKSFENFIGHKYLNSSVDFMSLAQLYSIGRQ